MSRYAVTFLHRRGRHVLSRRLPAMLGYSLGAIGLLLCTQVSDASVWVFIGCFSLATFGVEMTLSPSWAFCMDIGGPRSGAQDTPSHVSIVDRAGTIGSGVHQIFPALKRIVKTLAVQYCAQRQGGKVLTPPVIDNRCRVGQGTKIYETKLLRFLVTCRHLFRPTPSPLSGQPPHIGPANQMPRLRRASGRRLRARRQSVLASHH